MVCIRARLQLKLNDSGKQGDTALLTSTAFLSGLNGLLDLELVDCESVSGSTEVMEHVAWVGLSPLTRLSLAGDGAAIEELPSALLNHWHTYTALVCLHVPASLVEVVHLGSLLSLAEVHALAFVLPKDWALVRLRTVIIAAASAPSPEEDADENGVIIEQQSFPYTFPCLQRLTMCTNDTWKD